MANDRLATLIGSYVEMSLVYAAVRAELPELLANGAADVSALAVSSGFREDALERLLRGWEMIGLCERMPDGRFVLAPLGAELSKSSKNGWRDFVQLAVEQYAPAFSSIHMTLAADVLPFELAHGLPPFEYRRAEPHADRVFNRWLSRETEDHGDALAASYDWGGIDSVVDVAGGQGNLLRAIGQCHPTGRFILFEQRHVIDNLQVAIPAHERGVAYVAGDMFDTIPVAADLYILKSVLHDWSDDQALRILGNIHAAMPDGARLVVIERLLNGGGPHAHSTLLMDLHMLAVTGGKERTAFQFAALLGQAGFTPPKIVSTPTPFHFLESSAIESDAGRGPRS